MGFTIVLIRGKLIRSSVNTIRYTTRRPGLTWLGSQVRIVYILSVHMV